MSRPSPYQNNPWQQGGAPAARIDGPLSSAQQQFMTNVMGWMSMGMATTGLVAWVMSGNQAVMQFLYGSPWVPIALFALQLFLIGGLSSRITRMSLGAAIGAFMAISTVTGFSLSGIFMVYTSGSLGMTFFITAVLFGGLFGYGWVTKRDLTVLGNIMAPAIIAVIAGSVINIFLQSSLLYWGVTFIGIPVFMGLILYKGQEIKQLSLMADAESEQGQKLAIVGALSLYLAFLNLFLLLLRIFGDRR